MNENETARALQLAQTYFPSGPWAEEVEDMWLSELRSFHFEDIVAGLKELHDTVPSTWCPAWATIMGEALARTRARRQRELEITTERAALLPGPQVERLAFDRRWVKVAREGRDRVRDKPPSITHDHSDVRVGGFYVMQQWHTKKDGERVLIEERETAPMWHLMCPRCGSVDVPFDLWTADGARAARKMGRGATTMRQVAGTAEQIGAF